MKVWKLITIIVLIVVVVISVIIFRGRRTNSKKIKMLEDEISNSEEANIEEDKEGTWEEQKEVVELDKDKMIGSEYKVSNIEITENGKSIKIACNIINLNKTPQVESELKIIFKNAAGEEINTSNIKIAGMEGSENRFINMVIPTFERIGETADIEFEKV